MHKKEARRLQELSVGLSLPYIAGVEEAVRRSKCPGRADRLRNCQRASSTRDADRALVELREIDHFMDGLDGIHVGGMRGIEIVDVRRNDFASARERRRADRRGSSVREGGRWARTSSSFWLR